MMTDDLVVDPGREAQWEATDTREIAADALAEMRGESSRADTKAGHLLTLASLVTAGVTALAGRVSVPPAVVAMLGISAVPMMAALTVLLLVIRPAYGRTAPMPRYADPDGSTYAVALDLHQQATAPVMYLAGRIREQAAAAHRKYTGIRTAIDLVVVAGAGAACALVLAVIA